VAWCREHVTTRRPAFQFERTDVWSAKYNLVGPNLASDFVWPYPDDTFDVVVALAAFTHLMPRDAAHYLEEAARVLKPGGRCLLGWYLLDETSRERLATGQSPLAFKPHPIYHERCFTLDPEAAEETVAYDLDRISGYYARSGLTIETVRPGRWSGRPDGLSELDLILAVKPPASEALAS
jgi:SAM-dependent methyltransferase